MQKIARYSGWLLIAVVVAIPLIRWFTLDPLSLRFGNSFQTLSTIGKAGGIAGFVLYAINFVLSTRLKFLERLFGSLNRVYIAHHIVGGLALIALLFHPLFLALRNVEFWILDTFRYAAEFLVPRLPGLGDPQALFFADLAFNNGLIAFSGLVILLIITFFVKLPYRMWLWSHRLLGVFFAFAALHIYFMPTDLGRDPFFRYYMFGWALIGLVAFVYRVIVGNVFLRYASYRVSEVAPAAKNILRITLQPEKSPMTYEPGQFVFVKFLGAKEQGINEEIHPFSITSKPSERSLQLHVKMAGDFTRKLVNLKVGTKAGIEGAFGHFSYKRFGPRPQIWIAGGIGITPFLSMARSYDAESPPVTLIYSVIKKDELIEQGLLAKALPQANSHFRYFAYINDAEGGLLTADKVKVLTDGFRDKEILLCGPAPMMQSLRAQFIAAGMPKHRIHSEEFSLS